MRGEMGGLEWLGYEFIYGVIRLAVGAFKPRNQVSEGVASSLD